MNIMLAAFLLPVAVWLSPAFAQTGLSATDLRCEYLRDPLGIDVETPRLSWTLDSARRGAAQRAYQVLVAASRAALDKNVGDAWNSGKVNSDQSVFVTYGGRPLSSGAQYYWKVRVWDADGRASAWSRPAAWSMGLLKASDWRGQWIGAERGARRFPWLRKTFTLDERPERAFAYVNALGYYELYVNGKKVDDHVLSPAVSDYSKRNLYVTHDVTGYLVKGTNCIALWLGRGWYVAGHPGVVHDGPLARMQMDARLPGGAAVAIETDSSWKVQESPISALGKGTAFGDYGGERYDARLELKDWSSAGLDDSGWKPATIVEPHAAITAANMVEPNRIIQTLAAKQVRKHEAGGYLIDMGRNYTGWFELRLPAGLRADQTIRVEYADTLSSGDRFMRFNQRDEYVTRDGAGQAIRSRFNYHAFRYARVIGLDRAPSPQDAKGYLIRTSYSPAGDFECSNELLNRIYRAVNWTYQCLTLGGYVVDCPHRERLGYGGDAGTSMETGMFNFDAGGLYNRWSANWRDAQRPETGDIPYTAPAYPDQGGGGPMWSGFSITLPWQLYLQYGDKRILEISYPTMQKLLAFFETKTVDSILEPYNSYGMRMTQWNYLGDWVTPKREGPRGGPRDPVATRFINNCYYLYNLQLTAKIADILGDKAGAAEYEAKAKTLARVLHEKFYNPADHTYATGEQPYLAFPLLLGMVPEELRGAVMNKLDETIRVTNQGHIDAGMHGVYFLLRLLMRENRNDLVYEMATRKTYPSWGYMLEQGATTIWESWSGASHIHDTLISIGAWFTEGIGGIRFDEASPGFQHFQIKPGIVGDLKYARASYRSIRGEIVSDWRKEGGSFRLKVAVPPGTTATAWIPAPAPDAVQEGGRPLAGRTDVRLRGMENGCALVSLPSGRYEFTSKLPQSDLTR